jgi:hypothetical protein
VSVERQPTLSSSPPASGEPNAAEDAVVSTGDLLERIERLSAELALARAELDTANERAAAFTKERAARRQLSREVQRLGAIERERDELLAANEELKRHLESMWFQLRASEARGTGTEPNGAAGKGLLGRLGHRR